MHSSLTIEEWHLSEIVVEFEVKSFGSISICIAIIDLIAFHTCLMPLCPADILCDELQVQ